MYSPICQDIYDVQQQYILRIPNTPVYEDAGIYTYTIYCRGSLVAVTTAVHGKSDRSVTYFGKFSWLGSVGRVARARVTTQPVRPSLPAYHSLPPAAIVRRHRRTPADHSVMTYRCLYQQSVSNVRSSQRHLSHTFTTQPRPNICHPEPSTQQHRQMVYFSSLCVIRV